VAIINLPLVVVFIIPPAIRAESFNESRNIPAVHEVGGLIAKQLKADNRMRRYFIVTPG
jgi:hypothetical protein